MPSNNRPWKVAYDRAHYRTVSCYLRKEDAEKVADYAASKGISISALLKSLIEKEIKYEGEHHEQQEQQNQPVLNDC